MLTRSSTLRDWGLFILVALLPIIAMGLVAYRAVQNERAAIARAMDRELQSAAAQLTQQYEAKVAHGQQNNEAPPFADRVVLSHSGTLLEPVPPKQPAATAPRSCAGLLARARSDASALRQFLEECEEARGESGRLLWPVFALRSNVTETTLTNWFREHSGALSRAEAAITRREIEASSLPFKAALLRELSSGREPNELPQHILQDQAPRTTNGAARWRESHSLGNLERQDDKVVGFVVHPASLRRAVGQGWPETTDNIEARLVFGEPTSAPSVELLPDGAYLALSWSEANLLDRRTERSTWLLATTAAVGGILALVLAAALFSRMRSERRLSALRTDFVAAVSHELRTPLSSLRMLSELLAEGRVQDEDRTEVHAALAGEAKRLADTVDRLLTFSRMQAGKQKLVRQEVELDVALGEAIDTFERRHPGVDVQRDLPKLRARVDGDALRMVVENLLGNARKYAPEGTPYRVALSRRDGRVRIAVIDHGPGIAKRDRGRVFEPFERADDRLSEATEGSGIGLSLVRHVVRSHDGQVWVEGSEGGGASFIIEIPQEDSA